MIASKAVNECSDVERSWPLFGSFRTQDKERLSQSVDEPGHNDAKCAENLFL